MTLWELVSGIGSTSPVDLIVLSDLPESEPTYQECVALRITGLAAIILSWGSPQVMQPGVSAVRQVQVSLVSMQSLQSKSSVRYLALVDETAPGKLLQILDLGGDITMIPHNPPLVIVLKLISGPGETP